MPERTYGGGLPIMTLTGAAPVATVGHSGSTLAAVASYGLPGTAASFPGEPLGDAGWAALARETGRQRLSGLLMAAIADGALPVTAEQRAQARAHDTRVAARCLSLEALLVRVERLLADADVPVRVLKGSAVARLDYPDPRLRPFVDVDILVPAAGFDTAARCLIGVGLSRVYPEPRPGFDRRFGKGANFRLPDGTGVDVHRTFVMGPYGLRVSLEDLWRSAEPFDLGGQELLALPVEVRLLHACYHAVLGDWPPRLLPHRDIAQLLFGGRVDVPTLFGLSRHWHADALLALGVAGAWDLLGLTSDHPVLRWARGYRVPPAERRLVAVYAREHTGFAAKSLAAVTSIPGLRAKAAFVRALALPDRGYVRHRHASATQRLLHGLRQALGRPPRG